jgi:hypothetical protein
MEFKILFLGIFLLAAVLSISGCTTTAEPPTEDIYLDAPSESEASAYKTHTNTIMTFDYPNGWVIDYENTDYSGVYFNSSNGEIRVQIYETYGTPYASDEKPVETGVAGNKTYERYEYDAQSDSIVYMVALSTEKELLVRGPPEDVEGLLKIIETFQLK